MTRGAQRLGARTRAVYVYTRDYWAEHDRAPSCHEIVAGCALSSRSIPMCGRSVVTPGKTPEELAALAAEVRELRGHSHGAPGSRLPQVPDIECTGCGRFYTRLGIGRHRVSCKGRGPRY